MLRLIGKDFTLDISRARAELNYAPILTPDEGFSRMAKLAWRARDDDAGPAQVRFDSASNA